MFFKKTLWYNKTEREYYLNNEYPKNHTPVSSKMKEGCLQLTLRKNLSEDSEDSSDSKDEKVTVVFADGLAAARYYFFKDDPERFYSLASRSFEVNKIVSNFCGLDAEGISVIRENLGKCIEGVDEEFDVSDPYDVACMKNIYFFTQRSEGVEKDIQLELHGEGDVSVRVFDKETHNKDVGERSNTLEGLYLSLVKCGVCKKSKKLRKFFTSKGGLGMVCEGFEPVLVAIRVIGCHFIEFP